MQHQKGNWQSYCRSATSLCGMMMHKHGFEALDRTLQEVRGNKQLMGGMTLLLAGDFRQTLPIVSRGTSADELKACLKASYLWPNIEKLRLTTNVRVNLHGDETASPCVATLLTLGNGQSRCGYTANTRQTPSPCVATLLTLGKQPVHVWLHC